MCAGGDPAPDLWNPARHVDPKSLPTPGQILAAMTASRVGGEEYDKAWPQRAKRHPVVTGRRWACAISSSSGASGLIGQAIAADLMQRGLQVAAAARRLTTAQRDLFGQSAREMPIADLDVAQLRQMIFDSGADVVVNCLGLLQDQPGKSTQDVHEGFVSRLIEALHSAGKPVLLIHTSIPGNPADDGTAFALTKRRADRLIQNSGLPYAILRPGMVWAAAPYGGGAMLRALAALPVDVPKGLAARPFRFVAVEDIAETVAVLGGKWRPGEPMAAVFDLMHPRAAHDA